LFGSLFKFRWWVAALLLSASILSYFDRLTVSVLKTTLEHQFAFGDPQYALMVNLFLAAYGTAYIGSGWIVDRIGSRRSLAIFAVAWSIATIGCGLATSFIQLAIMQFLLGIAEPGVQPVTVRAAAVWAPPESRGTFMSICSMGSSIGAMSASALISFISIHYNWRLSFVIPGLLGFVVAAVWFATYRDPKSVTNLLIKTPGRPALPWLSLWGKRSLWGVLLARFIGDPVWYFVLFWMIGYLQDYKGATMQQIGHIAWIPFIAANIGGISLVALSDFLSRHTPSKVRSRKLVLSVVSLAAPLCWLIPHTSGLTAAIILFSILAIVSNTWLYMLSPVIAEIFPLGNVASIWGILGAFGSLGAILSNSLISRFPHTAAGRQAMFIMVGTLPLIATAILNLTVRNTPVPIDATE